MRDDMTISSAASAIRIDDDLSPETSNTVARDARFEQAHAASTPANALAYFHQQPTPSPQPGASPTPPVEPPVDPKWEPEDESKVKALISGALDRHNGNVEAAFAELRDQRQLPANYYDSNLAIAADYLRARWETDKCGPGAAATQVESYLALKQIGGVPKEGPGPVSPYSDLQAEYMRKGVVDEAEKMSFLEKAWWASPPGVQVGMTRAALSAFEGKEG